MLIFGVLALFLELFNSKFVHKIIKIFAIASINHPRQGRYVGFEAIGQVRQREFGLKINFFFVHESVNLGFPFGIVHFGWQGDYSFCFIGQNNRLGFFVFRRLFAKIQSVGLYLRVAFDAYVANNGNGEQVPPPILLKRQITEQHIGHIPAQLEDLACND